MKANRPRTAANTLEKLNRLFGTWLAEPLSTITVERIESWKIRRVNAGRVATTVMRDIFTLSTVLRRAVRVGKLKDNPVRWIDKPRIDRRPKIRYLDEPDEARLRAAMNARDTEMRLIRESGNARRQDRQEELLLALRWECVDLKQQILTVEGGTAKSRQTRHGCTLTRRKLGITAMGRARSLSPRGERTRVMSRGSVMAPHRICVGSCCA